MKIYSSSLALLIGLIAVALLPGRAAGQAFERVAAPDDETGPADFRISHMGPDGNVDFDALHPAAAYNSTDGTFLIVWVGDHQVNGDVEVFGQRLDARTGEALGAAFQISEMGPAGDPAFDAFNPAVVFNDLDNTFLVVWTGIDGRAGEMELFGQRLDASGAELGVDFRIAPAPARFPAVAFNRAESEYLVVWQGEERQRPGAAEIFGQRLSAAGEATGPHAFRISAMGADDDDAAYGAYRPALAYNADQNEYLVVWQGDDDRAAHVDDAFEIFGQRLGAKGEGVGATGFRISTMGPDGDPAYDAALPAVAYNGTAQEYLVVWLGDHHAQGLVDNELEVFGQRLDARSGEAVGTNGFRISSVGPDGVPAYDAARPAAVYNPIGEEYLVVWRGNGEERASGAYEIFGQRLHGDLHAGDERGIDDFRISRMGSSDDDTGFGAIEATIAFGGESEYLAVWYGDDDAAASDNEHEIFGRRIRAGAAGLELKELTAAVEDGGDVVLTWVTAYVREGARFEVQRRTAEGYDAIGEAGASVADDARQYAYNVQGLAPGRHFFRLKQTDANGQVAYSTDVEALVEVPGEFLFTNAYPNPFTESTTITLTLKEQQHVELAVYDMLGRRVRLLHEGWLPAGEPHVFALDADGLPNGLYMIRGAGVSVSATRPVMLVR